LGAERAPILLGTRSWGKRRELGEIFADFDFAIIELDAAGIEYDEAEDQVESYATFEENALAKARDAAAATGLVAVADDSGLAVDALNGMPGVLSARWSGRTGSRAERDAQNLALVLDQMADVPEARRGAAFVCAAAAAHPDGREVAVVERWPGTLIRLPRGTNGFGYDPVFVPEGESRTAAEMAPDEKDAVSHRAQALRALLPRLSELG